MVAFEIITIAVGVAGSALCATSAFRTNNTLGELGQRGSIWFDHADDHALADLPADDAVDAPITFRPLRSRLR
jgi:hypothetical protein